MSITYDLCCPEMKIKIWIGQSNYVSDFYVYSNDNQVMELLSKFLILTKGKRLVFVSDFCEDDEIINCEYFKG